MPYEHQQYLKLQTFQGIIDLVCLRKSSINRLSVCPTQFAHQLAEYDFLPQRTRVDRIRRNCTPFFLSPKSWTTKSWTIELWNQIMESWTKEQQNNGTKKKSHGGEHLENIISTSISSNVCANWFFFTNLCIMHVSNR